MAGLRLSFPLPLAGEVTSALAEVLTRQSQYFSTMMPASDGVSGEGGSFLAKDFETAVVDRRPDLRA
jgi:hypothetical protein